MRAKRCLGEVAFFYVFHKKCMLVCLVQFLMCLCWGLRPEKYFEDTGFPFLSDFNCCIYLTRWASLQLTKLSLQLHVGKQVLGQRVIIPSRD